MELVPTTSFMSQDDQRQCQKHYMRQINVVGSYSYVSVFDLTKMVNY